MDIRVRLDGVPPEGLGGTSEERKEELDTAIYNSENPIEIGLCFENVRDYIEKDLQHYKDVNGNNLGYERAKRVAIYMIDEVVRDLNNKLSRL